MNYKLETFLIIMGITLSIALGWVGNNLYSEKNPKEVCSTQARIAGLWLPNISDLKNYNGKYICVNIKETTTLKELVRVCEHEVGHEVFARECETNFTKCVEVSKWNINYIYYY